MDLKIIGCIDLGAKVESRTLWAAEGNSYILVLCTANGTLLCRISKKYVKWISRYRVIETLEKVTGSAQS